MSDGRPTPRAALLDVLAAQVPDAGSLGHPARVVVDGRDGAGKTTFADELAGALHARGRTVVRVSLDGFHRPREQRYAKGRTSPEGFWLDSYDYPRFVTEVLVPLGPGGSRRYRRAIHDVARAVSLDLPSDRAPSDAVLVVDGIFGHRDELMAFWDFSVFLEVPVQVALARMAARDGSSTDPQDSVNRRYVDGQVLYFTACRPHARATVVVDNTDVATPRLIDVPMS